MEEENKESTKKEKIIQYIFFTVLMLLFICAVFYFIGCTEFSPWVLAAGEKLFGVCK